MRQSRSRMNNLAIVLFTTFVFHSADAQIEPSNTAFSTSFCCASLSNTSLKDRLLFPGQVAYESRQSTYFDVKQQDLAPNCIVQPRTPDEVALAVKTLASPNNTEPCYFAIRSCGHTPYAGASNIDGGVTLDLQYLNTVKYDEKDALAVAGPAATWDDLFLALEPLGVMATGGRSGTVGVGGLTLGGGMSYFSPEHGFVCDNVVEFEVVLADGRIVTASKTSNPDLFTVLKGGNNNFGIVTQIKFRTFAYKGMWGGIVTYPESTAQEQFKALVNFAHNIDKNPKGAVIVIANHQSTTGTDLMVNTYDYAEPVSRPSSHEEFLAIKGNYTDSTALRNMSYLAEEFNLPTTYRVYFGTLTFAMDMRVLSKAHEIYKEVLSNLKSKGTGDWSTRILYQPLPPAYWRDSVARGGHILGFERFPDRVLCIYQPYLSWQGAEQDALFQSAGAELISRIREYAESIGADNPYLYLDYADKTQDPLAGYGAESVAKMRAAAKKYDPSEVFQKLVPGGFKISKVQ